MDYMDFKINEVKNGDVIVADFLIKTAEIKPTKKQDKFFIDLILFNSNTEIQAKKWDGSEEILKTFKDAYAIRVKATVNEWQGELQLIIEQYKVINESDISIDNFLPKSTISFDIMDQEFKNTIENISNPIIKDITNFIYKEKRDALKTHGGAKTQHHNYISGLMQHEYDMLMTAKAMVNNIQTYSDLNTDYLYAGIILHDLGKIDELKANKYGIIEDYTMVGELVGHLVIGSENIVEAACRLGLDKNSKELILLRHMMISHHGELEYGSNRNPMTREADLLYRLDNMNCHDTMIKNVIDTLNNNTFSNRQWALDNRKIFRGDN